MFPSSPAQHWDDLYQQRLALAPFVAATTSLRLALDLGLAHDAPILDVGCGTSAFLAGLLAQRYHNLLATDLSSTALEEQQRQVGEKQAAGVLWLTDDVLAPRHLAALNPILLWHDQGLLQEFSQLPQQKAYRQLLDHMVLPGGWVILAAAADTYSAGQLAALLGEAYYLDQHLEQPYARLAEPARPYTYAVFQRSLAAHATFRLSQVGNHQQLVKE